jgi:hypothetical protein
MMLMMDWFALFAVNGLRSGQMLAGRGYVTAHVAVLSGKEMNDNV